MPISRKEKNCLSCGKKLNLSRKVYCNNVCQHNFQYKRYINEWKAGKILGLQKIGTVSPSIKRYLREKFGNKCCLCGWAEINPITKKVPLVADHIDGNWCNNTENNLRLLCPNCDSLSSTYAGLNRGNGRKNRVLSKRMRKGRLMIGSPE